MSWHTEIRSRLLHLLLRRKEDRDLAEELKYHIELETEHNMSKGLPEPEARRRAQRDFGSVPRHTDDARDERGASSIDSWLKDTSFAVRSLMRQAGFTTLVLLTLAFGIGATTTLFAVTKGVLLEPLPYGRTETLAQIWSSWTGFPQTWLSYDEYEAWKTEIPAIEDIAIFYNSSANLTEGDEPERLRTASVVAHTFKTLGIAPLLGREFTEDEDRPGGGNVAILSYDLWQRRFSGDVSLIGKTIQLNGIATTVVGVMPPGFRMPLDFAANGTTQVYFPMATTPENEGAIPGPEMQQNGGSHGFYGIVRLAQSVTVEMANAQLENFVAGLKRDGVYNPARNFRAFVVGMESQVTGGVRNAILILFGATTVVLLIACANVAGLLLVRGERRRRELAIRVALGAQGTRLARLLFVESGLLALSGAVLGAAFAFIGVAAVRRSAPATFPRMAEVTIEPVVLLFSLAVAMLAAMLTGLLPALQATKVAPGDELKEGSRGATSGAGRLRWRQTLVSAEVALAVLLVVGAGLMVRSVGNLLAIDPGFRPDGVLAMRISTPSAWYPDSTRVVAFWDGLQRDVAAIPEVKSAGAVLLLPLATEMGDWGLAVEGYTPPPHTGTPADWQVVTPGYFETMGLRLVSGRFLDERDDMEGALSMVVNRKFVELYVKDREPLGTRVRIGGNSPDSLRYTIVGVVDDVRHNALTREVKAQFYASLAQFAKAPGNTRRTMSLVVRTDGDPMALVAPVRAAVRRADARLPVSEVRALEEVVKSSIAAPRFAMEMLGVFGVIALVLAAIGVFGVVSQVVALRQHEFGIRAALGASPSQLVGLSVKTGFRQVIAGLVVGIVAALVATRLLGALLHGVKPTDPLTFGIVVFVTGAVALLASVAPARRAAKAHPNVVLRTD